jgi:hypothetical protein
MLERIDVNGVVVPSPTSTPTVHSHTRSCRSRRRLLNKNCSMRPVGSRCSCLKPQNYKKSPPQRSTHTPSNPRLHTHTPLTGYNVNEPICAPLVHGGVHSPKKRQARFTHVHHRRRFLPELPLHLPPKQLIHPQHTVGTNAGRPPCFEPFGRP